MKTLLPFLLALLYAFPCRAGIDEQLRALTDSLDRGLPGSVSLCTLAVFPFVDETQNDQGVGTAVAEQIILLLQKNPRYRLVDRRSFQKAMAEVALSQSGAIDERAALEAGKALAARYILTGTISNAFGKKKIAAHITRTQTAETVSSAIATLPQESLTDIQKQLLGEKATVSAAVFRSLLLPGWGQMYTDHPVRGTIAMTVCLGGLGTTIWAIVASGSAKNASDAKNAYEFSQSYNDDLAAGRITEAQYLADKKTMYDKYSAAYDRMLLCVTITGAAWALNLVDATIAGVESRRAFEPYFSINPSGSFRAGLVYTIH